MTFRNSCTIGKRNQPLFTLSVWRGQAPGSTGNAIAVARRARGSLHKPAAKLVQRPKPEHCCCGWKAPSLWTPLLLHRRLAALPAQPLAGCCSWDEPGEGQVLGSRQQAHACGSSWRQAEAQSPAAMLFQLGPSVTCWCQWEFFHKWLWFCSTAILHCLALLFFFFPSYLFMPLIITASTQ